VGIPECVDPRPEELLDFVPREVVLGVAVRHLDEVHALLVSEQRYGIDERPKTVDETMVGDETGEILYLREDAVGDKPGELTSPADTSVGGVSRSGVSGSEGTHRPFVSLGDLSVKVSRENLGDEASGLFVNLLRFPMMCEVDRGKEGSDVLVHVLE
jgi:hypothetical protein